MPCGAYGGGKMTPPCSSVVHLIAPRFQSTSSGASYHLSSPPLTLPLALLLLLFLTKGALGMALLAGDGLDACRSLRGTSSSLLSSLSLSSSLSISFSTTAGLVGRPLRFASILTPSPLPFAAAARVGDLTAGAGFTSALTAGAGFPAVLSALIVTSALAAASDLTATGLDDLSIESERCFFAGGALAAGLDAASTSSVRFESGTSSSSLLSSCGIAT
mmetsp:Transcript_57939/g.125838  ORF Transcript_57939/g.125838 Transcript_57939/m.125838 type:complete len:218 (+) Transcript_57939:2259-2912(+)